MSAIGRWVLPLDGAALPDRALVGGKAWGIAFMRHAGLPVPPAFVVTTEACRAYLAERALPGGLLDELLAGIAVLEGETGRRFGVAENPLLLSIRSGAAISMPGMLDTVLNLGINEAVEAALARESGDAAFARETHRRFYEMYARIVLKAGLDRPPTEGTVEEWRAAVAEAGAVGTVPAEPRDQLHGAVRAVFDSWNGRRAKRYRKHHCLSDDAGTAVTVQAMVFGNLGPRSGTGVLFTRNPLSGAPEPYGESLALAQGEDMVSGRRTPLGLGALEEALARVSAAQVRTLLMPRLADGAAETALLLAEGEGASPGVGMGEVVLDADAAEARGAAGEDVVLVRPTTSPTSATRHVIRRPPCRMRTGL